MIASHCGNVYIKFTKFYFFFFKENIKLKKDGKFIIIKYKYYKYHFYLT